MFCIAPATPDQMDDVRSLFREYWSSLNVSPCFQNFDRELTELPGAYDPILLASGLSGCAALRPLTDAIAEMKRLYVRPQHRGNGLGRQLAEAIIETARTKGYQAIRLDTLPQLLEAIAMYRRMGFREIAPYYENPVSGALFMEKEL